MNKVLFLCTGNYYRSRFAEILFNWLAAERCQSWRADSRGLDPDPNNFGPLSFHTVRAMKRMGIPLQPEPRFPIRATEADFLAAQHIVAVKEAEHRPMVEQWFSAHADRVEFWHVHDLDCAGPAEALSQLERLVGQLIDRLSYRQ